MKKLFKAIVLITANLTLMGFTYPQIMQSYFSKPITQTSIEIKNKVNIKKDKVMDLIMNSYKITRKCS